MRLASTALGIVWLAALAHAQTPAPAAQKPAPAASPASQRPPSTVTPQSYPREQIDAGRTSFVSRCGFCHGRDAGGGEGGSDLTRSTLVAEDVRGDKIGPVVRSGRPDKGMPPFALPETELAAIVAFIHDAKTSAESSGGGRRTVEPEDLQTGDAKAGEQYFRGAGGCVRCHAVAGEFAKVGARYRGLPLLQRMLYPGSGRDAGPPPSPPEVTVRTRDGDSATGKVIYRDEFTISIRDAQGWTRSWPLARVAVTGDEPLRAHVEQLPKYTDRDMHNVLAFLQTLR
jgi:cytochrome c oxidase cbb3-type subunit 3